MTRADLFAGLLLAAGFGAALWEAWSFQYGTEFAPGPGFAPVWLSAIGVGLALLLAFNAARARRDPERVAKDEAEAEALDKPGLVRVGATLAGLALMLVIASWLGLVLSLFIFLLFLTLGVQRLSLPIGIGASLGTAVFAYVVFVFLLGVPIPSGPLGF